MTRRVRLGLLVGLLALLAGSAGAGVSYTASGLPAAGRLAFAAPAPPDAPAGPLVVTGSGFTYQGRLQDGGAPANGAYDFTFTLYDAASGGNQINDPVTLLAQPVSDGLVTVNLDFGATAFAGDARWLEIAVRPAGGGSYTTLAPRQPVTATPYALYAMHGGDAQRAPWLGITGKPAEYNPLRLPTSLSTLTSPNTAGGINSVAAGADGLGLISYTAGGSLKVLHCNDLACTGATQVTLASGVNSGDVSVTVGADGLGLISYAGNSSLKVAHCNDAACTSAALATVDGGYLTGDYNAVTVGADGLPLFSYHDGYNGGLKAAHCNNVTCTSATQAVVDSDPAAGDFVSLAVGADGLGLISYHDDGNSHLKVAHCNDVACSSASLATIDNASRNSTSLAVGVDGLGLISFWDYNTGHLKAAHCNNLTCSSAAQATLDGRGQVGTNTSLTVGADGLGLISYADANAHLAIAHCANAACTTASLVALDNSANTGSYSSVTVGVDGLPLISYLDATNGALKVAHCGSAQCVAYQHRR